MSYKIAYMPSLSPSVKYHLLECHGQGDFLVKQDSKGEMKVLLLLASLMVPTKLLVQ